MPASTETLKQQEQVLLELKNAEKYVPEPALFYPGITSPELKPVFTERINLAIDGFLAVVRSGKPTKEAYLEVIRTGLAQFPENELDREDKDRTAAYFEEMMDCVGLDSSEGLLNDFTY